MTAPVVIGQWGAIQALASLTINAQSAKALGLTVPRTLLVAADEVIE